MVVLGQGQVHERVPALVLVVVLGHVRGNGAGQGQEHKLKLPQLIGVHLLVACSYVRMMCECKHGRARSEMMQMKILSSNEKNNTSRTL